MSLHLNSRRRLTAAPWNSRRRLTAASWNSRRRLTAASWNSRRRLTAAPWNGRRRLTAAPWNGRRRLTAAPWKVLAGSAALLLGCCGLGTAAAAAPTPPATITAQLIKPQRNTAKVGTTVPLSGLGQRVFVNQRLGFALGGVGQAQYPAKTTDGGAVWKTFGPALHVNAAQAPLAVTEIGVANARTVYYFGSGQVVDVTGDGGKHWWRAFSQELSVAVVPGIGRRLLWFTQMSTGANGTNAVTWPYVSTDGGKVWHYTTALGGGF